jgi:hypothetical protein
MNNLIKLLLVVLFVLLVTGCATTSGGRSRGSLSNAMDKASDENEGDRTVQTTYNDDDDDSSSWLFDLLFGSNGEVDDEEDAVPPQPASRTYNHNAAEASTAKPAEPAEFFLQMSMGSGPMYNQDLYGHMHFNIGFGSVYSANREVVFTGQFSHSNVQQTSQLSHSLSGGLDFFGFDFTLRNYTTKEYTFIGHYLMYGGGVSWIHWNYKNPIYATNGLTTEKITSDYLGGINAFVGTGFQLFQTAPVRCNLEVVPGIYFWGLQTAEDFDNDIFDPMPYLNLRLSFNFGSTR